MEILGDRTRDQFQGDLKISDSLGVKTNILPILKKLFEHPWRFAFFISLVVFAIAFPAIFFWRSTPLGPNTWELQDPVTSFMAFVPAVKSFRFEFLNHHQILWTRLKNFGTPVLANEIHASPLFPLTLLTFWIPDPYFWNVFVTGRVVLLGMAAFLIAFEIFKFSRLQSFIFMVVFPYGVYMMRWMNHSYQTGMTASLWYFYAIAKGLQISSIEKFGYKRFFSILGQTLAVYSMITCGFPEAAAVGAVITTLAMIPLVIAAVTKKEVKVSRLLGDLALSHILGFALSSPQTFALVEYVRQAGPGFRNNIGLVQFDSFETIWPWITKFAYDPPPGSTIHFFGLIALFLFVWGFVGTFIRPKKVSRYDIAALLAGAFYMVKCFKVWPAFNQFIGNLPVLSQSWFIVYFLPVLLCCVAYFSAKGASLILNFEATSKRKFGLLFLLSVTFMVLVFFLARSHASNPRPGITLRLVFTFLTFIGLVTSLPYWKKSALRYSIFTVIFGFLVLLEVGFSYPGKFLSYKAPAYFAVFDKNILSQDYKNLIQKAGIPLEDFREKSGHGEFISAGVATLDNGAPPILTERTKALRTELFVSDWGGYLPIQKTKIPAAYRLTSTAFDLMPTEQVKPFLKKQGKEAAAFKRLGTIGGYTVLQDQKALSRAYLPSKCVQSGQMSDSVAILKDDAHFQWGSVAVENLSKEEADFCKNYSGTLSHLSILRDRGSQITLDQVSGPRIVVLNDAYYPGWKVRDQVSGSFLDIKPANINFKAVLLPENRVYKLEFFYEPIWLKWSYLLIGLSVFTLLFLGRRAYRTENQK